MNIISMNKETKEKNLNSIRKLLETLELKETPITRRELIAQIMMQAHLSKRVAQEYMDAIMIVEKWEFKDGKIKTM